MTDFTRRRFLFGLAAVPLVVSVVKHFVMPKWEVAQKGFTYRDHGWWRVEDGYNDDPPMATGRDYHIHPTEAQYRAMYPIMARAEKQARERWAARARAETAIAAFLA